MSAFDWKSDPMTPEKEQEFARRVLAAVLDNGTTIKPSVLNLNMMVVVNGLTGADACERTTRACFETLFNEEDGNGSPGRIGLCFSEVEV